MAKTNAEHQRAFRRRQKDRIAELEAEVNRLNVVLASRASGHAACDALERDLRAEIEQLRSARPVF